METLEEEMKRAQGSSPDHNIIVQLLMNLQEQVNWEFLRQYSKDNVHHFFGSLWKFLLFAGAHQNTSVRLAAYRTTGAFLLKVTPYYTAAIHETFSEIAHASTLSPDVKGSAIIASAFSFISNFNAGPYLNEFLNRTPVFHHFSISDPVFFDHLAPIIRNLGRLGIDWLTGLLQSFLGKLSSVSDRYLILSIAAVIKHDPIRLMNELLLFVREQLSVKDHLSLISYLFSVIDCRFETLDFWDVAEAALDVLGSEKATQNDIDSSFQILGFQSESFSLVIDFVDEETLKLMLCNHDKTVSKEMELKTAPYLNRPSFYCLCLPLKLFHIKDDDGVLQLTAKFRTMARIVNYDDTPKEVVEEIIGYFIEFMSRKYDDKMSACMQGLSLCLPTMLRKCSAKDRMMYLISRSIFTKCQSWYHAGDIIRIIKVLPVEYYGANIKLESVLDQLLEYAMNRNEKLQVRAKKVVVRLVNATDFERYSAYIANRIDYHDIDNVMTHLDILTTLLTDTKGRTTIHLRHVIFILLEAAPMYENRLDLITKILMFIGSCDLTFLERRIGLLKPWFSEAIAIIYACRYLLTGQRWEVGLASEVKERATDMIGAYLASMNYDVISEKPMDYATFLTPFAAALKFLFAIPVKGLEVRLMIDVFNQTYNFFPFHATRLMHKYWNYFKANEQVECMNRLYQILEYIPDYGPATVWCALFMVMTYEQQVLLRDFVEKPEKIALWAIHNADFHGVFYGFEIYINDDLTEIEKDIGCLTESDRDDLYAFLERNFPIVMKKLRGENIKPQGGISMSISQANIRAYDLIYGKGEEDEDEKTTEVLFEDVPEVTLYGDMEDPDADSVPVAGPSFDIKVETEGLLSRLEEPLDNGDLLIKTQLRRQTYEFSKEKLQDLLVLYCGQADIGGIVAVLRYVFNKAIELSDVNSLVFPTETLPKVIQYLWKVKSPEFYLFISKVSKLPNDSDTEVSLNIYDAQNYIQHIEDAEKLHKSEVVMFCKCLWRSRFDPKVITRLTRKFLEASGNSVKRKTFNAYLILIVFHLVPNISDNFMDTCAGYIRSNIEFLSHDIVSRCLSIMNRRIETGRGILELVKLCLPQFQARTVPFLICHQVMLSFPNMGLPEREIQNLLASYVESNLPSVFCSGVRYIFFALAKMNDEMVQQILKRHLKAVLVQFSVDKFMNISTVADAVGPLLEALLLNNAFKRHYELLFKMCTQFIPKSTRAAFLSVARCVPALIMLMTGPSTQWICLCKESESLVTSPMSLSLFNVYIMSVSERLSKCPDDKSKDDFLIDTIEKWKATCGVCDCMAMPDVVFEWERLIYQKMGPQRMFSYVIFIYKYTERFFPFFVGFVKFVRTVLMKNIMSNEQDVEDFLKTFAVMGRCRSQSLAFLLTNDRKYTKVALSLAVFDKDCPESEAIINSDPKLLQLLASLNE